MNESDIKKGCLKNNRESQKALYDLYYNKMLSVCLRYSKDSAEAKGILLEGFFKVFATIKNHKESEPLEEWIKKTIIETAVEHLKKNNHNLIVSTFNATKATKSTTDEISDDEVIASVDEETILRALQELTPAYRKVFNLSVIEGYPHKKIADMLDTSEDTSESNLAKAKFNLRKNLQQSIRKSDGK
jgi:RNA polymerase sigma factor (sigma-70 family)